MLKSIGPQISVFVGPDKTSEQFRLNTELLVPSPIQAFALIDTGATITSIDAAIIQELGLSPTGVIEIETAHSRGIVPMYDIRLVISNVNETIVFDSLSVAAATLEHKRHRVLLGQDVLKRFVFTYDGPRGMFRLQW